MYYIMYGTLKNMNKFAPVSLDGNPGFYVYRYVSSRCNIQMNLTHHTGLPVVWAISNHEDSDTLKAVLRATKARCPTAVVSTVMTDDGKQIQYYM